MAQTITFSEKNIGWTSFHSWIPEAMCRLNNRFFTIKEGQLYLHNDRDNPIRNNFYGEQFSSRVVTIINESPELDKIFKTLNLEGNKSWEATVRTNFASSTIKREEYIKRESRHFAFLRKNENDEDLHGHSAQGLGVIQSNFNNQITFSKVTESISVGDILMQVDNDVTTEIGVIENIESNTITVSVVANNPINGLFAFSKKPSRVEGGEIRGYFMEVELENDDTDMTELFAVTSNTVKSGV